MTQITTHDFEAVLGAQMAALARSEGHRPGLPKISKEAVEKQKATNLKRHYNRNIGLIYKHRIIEAIRAGIKTTPQIAKAKHIPQDSVRKACRELAEAGKIRNAGIVSVSGGQTKIWEIAKP